VFPNTLIRRFVWPLCLFLAPRRAKAGLARFTHGESADWVFASVPVRLVAILAWENLRIWARFCRIDKVRGQ